MMVWRADASGGASRVDFGHDSGERGVRSQIGDHLLSDFLRAWCNAVVAGGGPALADDEESGVAVVAPDPH